MFVLELEFDDDERRLAARPAHRDRLRQLHAEGLLKLAGPWADDSGALLVFDTDEAGVRRIMEEDPYYSVAGVKVASLREWQPIAGN
ncbi:YciI family protein [Saccharothrix sp. AJ9571]|nr:YciI family protein [Saccharothrix sp. AJ9571]